MVRIHHPPVRIAKESSLLNAVEEVTVAPFGFQFFANIDEDMNRVRVRPFVRGHFRRGYQEAAIRQEFDRSFDASRLIRTKRAQPGDFLPLGSKDFVDRAPDQPGRMNSQPRGERTVDSNDFPFRVVNNDRVRNRINDPDPALPLTMHLFKQARVFEQAAKTGAEERQPFQKLFRNLCCVLPRRKGRAMELAMTENRNSNFGGSATAIPLTDFLR